MILTTNEAASELGVTPFAIRKMVERRELAPAVPGARPLRFRLVDVWEAQARRVKPADSDRLDTLYAQLLATETIVCHDSPYRGLPKSS